MSPSLSFKSIVSQPDLSLRGYEDRNIHQTEAWINFIAETQGAAPVYAVLTHGDMVVGRFAGLIVEKFGIKILGSPFPMWSTTYMGLNLARGVPMRSALNALEHYCFEQLRCDHLELMDKRFTPEDALAMGYKSYIYESFEIDLEPDEESIFRSFRHSCRNCIRKAGREGVTIEEAEDLYFAREYHEQLSHVFQMKGLAPPFGLNRVEALIRWLRPTGNLLLLRARNSDGLCIATGIFPALNTTAYAWGSASLRDYSGVRPNELIFFHAMKYWKHKGMKIFDLVGAADYKKKYGARKTSVPWIRKSRNSAVAALRTMAEAVLLKYPGLTSFVNRFT